MTKDKLFSELKQGFHISGGFGRGSSLYKAGEEIVKLVIPEEDQNFDYITTELGIEILRTSKFEYGCCGILGYKLGLRTPEFIGITKDNRIFGDKSIVIETGRCKGEKLYNILCRTRDKNKTVTEVYDETAQRGIKRFSNWTTF